jgi:hypothetical protein
MAFAVTKVQHFNIQAKHVVQIVLLLSIGNMEMHSTTNALGHGGTKS